LQFSLNESRAKLQKLDSKNQVLGPSVIKGLAAKSISTENALERENLTGLKEQMKRYSA